MLTTGARFLMVVFSLLGAGHLLSAGQYWWTAMIFLVASINMAGPSKDPEARRLLKDPTLFSAALYAVGLAAIVYLAENGHPWWAAVIGIVTFVFCDTFSDQAHGEKLEVYVSKAEKATIPALVTFAMFMFGTVFLITWGYPWWGLALIGAFWLVFTYDIEPRKEE